MSIVVVARVASIVLMLRSFPVFNAYDSNFEEYVSLIEIRKSFGSCLERFGVLRVNGALERELVPIQYVVG